ncbi:hypothetical protein G3N57_23090 [Paraburkholderia sp. Se-20369]|nr:hypothetical protein [Paraburkholderia sp. Se-20369]
MEIVDDILLISLLLVSIYFSMIGKRTATPANEAGITIDEFRRMPLVGPSPT